MLLPKMMLLPSLLLALALLLARDAAAACGPALPHCLRGNDSIYGFGPGDPESHSASACCAAAQAWAPQAQAWELATRVPATHGPECNIMAEFVPTNRTGLRCTSGRLVAGANAGHNLQAEPRSTTVTASLEQATAPPFSPETDKIIWNLGKTATPATGGCPKLGEPCPLVTVNRTLTDRLAERITVLVRCPLRATHSQSILQQYNTAVLACSKSTHLCAVCALCGAICTIFRISGRIEAVTVQQKKVARSTPLLLSRTRSITAVARTAPRSRGRPFTSPQVTTV